MTRVNLVNNKMYLNIYKHLNMYLEVILLVNSYIGHLVKMLTV